jgi:oligoendopeptidase F
MAKQTITTWKNRADIPEKYRWRLEDIYRSDEDWEAAFAAVPRLLEQTQAWRGRLAESGGNLLAALEQSSLLDLELMELMAYARMRRDEDNAVSRYQDMADRATGLYYQAAAATAFLTPEIAALPEAELRVWLDSEEGLRPFQHQLENILRNRSHILPEAEEALLASFGPVADGIGDVFTMLNNVDIKLGSVDDGQGGRIDLTHATFSLLREHKDRSVRAAAFAQMHEAFAAVGQTVAALYATQVKADILQARARKHPDSLSAALFGDNLPSGLHSGLLDALHDGAASLGRYLDLRRRSLELPDLHFYDAYVPIIAQPEKSYTFEEACDLLRKGLAPLGPRYLADLERHLENRWIDVCETPGKTSGAYSWGSYRSHPYILLNWNGSLSDVFTLAHEIGHSMHTFYSSQRPFSQAHYPIFLAEIASTVNENLLMQFLLAACDEQLEAGRQEKAYLLNHFLDEFRTTVHRQTLFAEFEWQAHQRAERGDALTAEWLCGQYGQLLQQYYGSQMTIDGYMRWEWARIPHFYNAFYVFKYATGFSAAVALSRQILSEQPGAADRYMRFLGAGGSDYPLATMAATGLDLASRQPVDDALDEFSARLTQLNQLIDGRQGSWKPN